MSIGWAIISTGDYADSRGAPGINQAQDAMLVAVYSRDQGRGEAFAEKHGAKTAYTSVEDLLTDSRVDAVYITSPNHLHAPYATMAANAGKHALVEKPLSLNMAEGVEVLRVCRDRGVKVGVGLHLRHHPGHIETRRLVADGVLGTVAGLCYVDDRRPRHRRPAVLAGAASSGDRRYHRWPNCGKASGRPGHDVPAIRRRRHRYNDLRDAPARVPERCGHLR